MGDTSPQEDNINFDQYTKAFYHNGAVPGTQGRLMNMVEQAQVFEQNFIRVMKGLSPGCEFYTKLMLNGLYEFLDRLRHWKKKATEQAAQTFAEKQAEEYFHPQLEALVITWITNQLPEVVRKRYIIVEHNQVPGFC